MASSDLSRERQGLPGMLVGRGDSVVKGRVSRKKARTESRSPGIYSIAHSDGHGAKLSILCTSTPSQAQREEPGLDRN